MIAWGLEVKNDKMPKVVKSGISVTLTRYHAKHYYDEPIGEKKILRDQSQLLAQQIVSIKKKNVVSAKIFKRQFE